MVHLIAYILHDDVILLVRLNHWLFNITTLRSKICLMWDSLGKVTHYMVTLGRDVGADKVKSGRFNFVVVSVRQFHFLLSFLLRF